MYNSGGQVYQGNPNVQYVGQQGYNVQQPQVMQQGYVIQQPQVIAGPTAVIVPQHNMCHKCGGTGIKIGKHGKQKTCKHCHGKVVS